MNYQKMYQDMLTFEKRILNEEFLDPLRGDEFFTFLGRKLLWGIAANITGSEINLDDLKELILTISDKKLCRDNYGELADIMGSLKQTEIRDYGLWGSEIFLERFLQGCHWKVNVTSADDFDMEYINHFFSGFFSDLEARGEDSVTEDNFPEWEQCLQSILMEAYPNVDTRKLSALLIEEQNDTFFKTLSDGVTKIFLKNFEEDALERALEILHRGEGNARPLILHSLRNGFNGLFSGMDDNELWAVYKTVGDCSFLTTRVPPYDSSYCSSVPALVVVRSDAVSTLVKYKELEKLPNDLREQIKVFRSLIRDNHLFPLFHKHEMPWKYYGSTYICGAFVFISVFDFLNGCDALAFPKLADIVLLEWAGKLYDEVLLVEQTSERRMNEEQNIRTAS